METVKDEMPKLIHMIILLLCTTLLLGCGSNPVAKTDDGQLVKDYEALQADYNNLRQGFDRLERANNDLAGIRDKYNEMAAEHGNLQIKYAVLEAQYQSVSNQYGELAEKLSKAYMGDEEALKEFNEQYQLLVERQRELTEQIEAVRTKKIKLLSDNLTDEEYNAFCKGWNLWWGTFND